MELLLTLSNGISKLLTSYAEVLIFRLSLGTLNREILELLIKLCKLLLNITDLRINILPLCFDNGKFLILLYKLSLEILDLTCSA